MYNMRNIQTEGNIITFRIRGHSSVSDVVEIGLGVIGFAVWLMTIIFVFKHLEGIVDRDAAIYVIAILLVPLIIFIAGWIYLCSFAFWARYQVHIDLDDKTITARDRFTDSIPWQAPFEPEHLYLTHTRIQGRYTSHLCFALVYGDPPQDLVEDNRPNERTTMLTTASESKSLQAFAQSLGKD